jgi:hypothetical protein
VSTSPTEKVAVYKALLCEGGSGVPRRSQSTVAILLKMVHEKAFFTFLLIRGVLEFSSFIRYAREQGSTRHKKIDRGDPQA